MFSDNNSLDPEGNEWQHDASGDEQERLSDVAPAYTEGDDEDYSEGLNDEDYVEALESTQHYNGNHRQVEEDAWGQDSYDSNASRTSYHSPIADPSYSRIIFYSFFVFA